MRFSKRAPEPLSLSVTTANSPNKYLFYLFYFLLIIYLFGWRKICADWWFEDDPYIFSFASQINNPFEIFTSRAIITGYGAGKAFAPMQLFSYWLDTLLGDIRENIWIAYLHQTISYLFCSFIVYKLSFKISKSYLLSFCISFLWTLAPSTLSVLENLSTRHYIEGLIFALLAIIMVLSHGSKKELYKTIAFLCGISICIFISMLFKEIYAGVLLSVIFIYSFFKRHWMILLITIVEAVVYFIYRYAIMGVDVTYTMPFLSWPHYLEFLLKLPYTFAANYFGYIGYFLIIGLLLYELVYNRNFKLFGGITIILCISLLVIFPVSFALSKSYLYPGTWYRGYFLLNTCLIGSLLLLVINRAKFKICYLIILIPIIAMGAFKTQSYWKDLKSHATAEAQTFLLDKKDFLYGTQAAYWFIPGVALMYGESLKNYAHFSNDKDTILKKMSFFEKTCVYKNKNITCTRNNKYEIQELLGVDLKKELNLNSLKISFIKNKQHLYQGVFDEAACKLSGDGKTVALIVRGWVVKTPDNEKNLLVIITGEDRNVVTATFNRHPRPDVAKVFSNSFFEKSGWNKKIVFEEKDFNLRKLTAWVYIPNNRKAYFIDDIFISSKVHGKK